MAPGRRSIALTVLAVAACGGPGEAEPSVGSAASSAPAPAAATTTVAGVTSTSTPRRVATMSVVSQNVLHGRSCPPETDRCRLSQRIDLFAQQLHDAACPEIVLLQEFDDEVASLLAPRLADCGYDLVWDADAGLDREALLTTERAVDSSRIGLPGNFRTALFVHLETEVGAVVVVVTHLASSADDRSCAPSACPEPCDPEGSFRECQARVLVSEVLGLGLGGDVLVVVGGDLNTTTDESTYSVFAEHFVDVFADRLSCGPDRPRDCTAGRASTSMTDLTDPSSVQRERVDHLFMLPNDGCTVLPTSGVFSPEPSDGPVAFVSDHSGLLLRLSCAELSGAASVPPLPRGDRASAPAPAGAPADDDVAVSVRRAFEALFDGRETDIDRRLWHLEGGEARREQFVRLVEAAGDVASTTSVEVETVTTAPDGSVDVLFDVLVDGAVVFDDRPGRAVLHEGRWTVAAATFCELASLLAPDGDGC